MAKILLVEDDDALSLGIEFNLTSEDFDVMRAKSKKDALEKFKEAQIDLIILDIGLPDGNGYEVCKEIRKSSDVPIIFLTAYDDEVNAILGLEVGGDDYITKPFRAKEFIWRIRAVLRRYKKEDIRDKNIMKCMDLKIDTTKGIVYKDNNIVHLTSQEYKLLLILVNNHNILLSRDKILDLLYNGDDGSLDPMDNSTLSVYIKRLREKIEDDDKNPKYILTKRGMGYIWDANITLV